MNIGIDIALRQLGKSLDEVEMVSAVVHEKSDLAGVGVKRKWVIEPRSIVWIRYVDVIIEHVGSNGSVNELPLLYASPDGSLDQIYLTPTFHVEKKQWVYQSLQPYYLKGEIYHWLNVLGTITNAEYRIHYTKIRSK